MMCLRDSEDNLFYNVCRHTLSVRVCTKYAPGLEMCTDDPIRPRKSTLSTCPRIIEDKCAFCKADKDPRETPSMGRCGRIRAKYQ
jgi:hypothetical protein